MADALDGLPDGKLERCAVRVGNALGVRGPLHPTSSSQDFDIELRWTGKEKAAVRLLAVRDTVAQLLLSLDSTGSSTNYKQTTLRWLNRILVGTGYASLDNAARIHDTGYGEQLPRYSWTDGQLAGAIARLLGDEAMRGRLATLSARMQSAKGAETAAEIIARIAGS